MKYIKSYQGKFNENYRQENTTSSTYYYFTNKDGIEFKVCFHKRQNIYEREYYTINREKKFGDLNTNDVYGIMTMITKITIDFIKEHQPNEIVIYHIPSEKERELIKSGTIGKSTKRALINKRFLEKSIPENYTYELKGSSSYIKKIK